MNRHGSPIQTAAIRHASANNGAQGFFVASLISPFYRRLYSDGTQVCQTARKDCGLHRVITGREMAVAWPSSVNDFAMRQCRLEPFDSLVCDRRVIQAEVFEVRHSAEVRQTRIRHRRVSKVEFSEVRQSVQMSQADVRHFRASKGKLFKVCESSQVNQTGIRPHRVIEPEFSEIR